MIPITHFLPGPSILLILLTVSWKCVLSKSFQVSGWNGGENEFCQVFVEGVGTENVGQNVWMISPI